MTVTACSDTAFVFSVSGHMLSLLIALRVFGGAEPAGVLASAALLGSAPGGLRRAALQRAGARAGRARASPTPRSPRRIGSTPTSHGIR